MFHAIKLVVLLAALPEARDELLRVWEGIKPEEYEKAPKGPSAREVRKARLEAYLAGDKGAYFS